MRSRIAFTHAAARQLRNLSRRVQERIAPVIDTLAGEHFPSDSRNLAGRDDLWRVRVGEYEVVYAVRDEVVLVVMVRAENRREVYNRL